jgi:HTH-type transcriptional regulator / antitoxin HipB
MPNTPEELGDLIKQIRKRKGLTQKELSQRMGISDSAVNKYESGKENPTLHTLRKIAAALGVELEITFRDD